MPLAYSQSNAQGGSEDWLSIVMHLGVVVPWVLSSLV